MKIRKKVKQLTGRIARVSRITAGQHSLVYERDAAIVERDAAIAERDAALAERDAAIAERDAALAERDAVIGAATWLSGLELVDQHDHHGEKDSLSRVAALRSKPWYTVNLPAPVVHVDGMIHFDERRMLYTLARDYFHGEGRIIDGGAYLGASSLALGWGLKHREYRQERVIDAFDMFIIDEHSVRHHLSRYGWPQTIKPGDNVRSLYEHNISSLYEYIDIHEGNLKAARWGGYPIEILFSDIAKGWDLNDYIIQNWFPYLIPGIGVLIQQDQVQEYHVWVAITQEVMSEYFEFIDYVVNDSVVYRLRHAVPEHVLHKCLSINISAEEMEYYYLSWVERFRRMGAGRYRGWTLGMVEAGLVVTYGFHIGDRDKAFYALHQCEEKFAAVPDTVARLATIRGHLEAKTPCPGSRLYW